MKKAIIIFVLLNVVCKFSNAINIDSLLIGHESEFLYFSALSQPDSITDCAVKDAKIKTSKQNKIKKKQLDIFDDIGDAIQSFLSLFRPVWGTYEEPGYRKYPHCSESCVLGNSVADSE